MPRHSFGNQQCRHPWIGIAIFVLAVLCLTPAAVCAGQLHRIPLQEVILKYPAQTFRSRLESSILVLEGLNPAIVIPINTRPFDSDRIVIDYTRPNTFNNIGLMVIFRNHSGRQQFKQTLLFPSFTGGGQATIDLLDLPTSNGSIEFITLFFIGREESIQIRGLSIETLGNWQRMLLPWRRFWKLDEFEPYTINSLHGPRAQSGSANGYLYAIIAAVALPALAAGVFFSRRRQGKRKKIAYGVAGAAVMAGIVFYDARMTIEFTKYTADNYQYWVAAPNQYKNYKKVYANLPLFTEWAEEQLQSYGVKRYRLQCPQEFIRYFFDYQVYPFTEAPAPEALVVWRDSYRIRGGNSVEYGQGRSFRFSKQLTHPLFSKSAIFIAEDAR